MYPGYQRFISRVGIRAGHNRDLKPETAQEKPLVPRVRVMVTRVKFGKTISTISNITLYLVFNKNAVETFTSVAITICKHKGNVFYCFYEIKARSNFLCFHRVIEPIRVRMFTS